MNPIFIAFAVLYALFIAVQLFLEMLNLSHLKKYGDEIPPGFEGAVAPELLKKSKAYTVAKTRFGIVHMIYGAGILWLLILSGAFSGVDGWLTSAMPNWPFLRSLAYPIVFAVGFYMANLPFSLYSQFVLEERFGFNRMNAKTFIGDQIKVAFLAALLGLPLIALLFWLVNKTGDAWWIYGFGAILLFQIATAALFPVFLAPLFYKFTPLEEGELKASITALAARLKFKMAGIFTIDGSRRSAHSNAFFAGLGRTRRIVLFDTLTQSLNTPEIVAVIAHEMGHNIKKHVPKNLVLSCVTTFFSFAALAYCLKWPLFFEAFGVANPSVHVGFVLFLLMSPVFTFVLTPAFNALSRKYEYEADAFSVETTKDAQSLSQGLIKLAKDNLSNLSPHPLYSFYHYSHPTVVERINRYAIDRSGNPKNV